MMTDGNGFNQYSWTNLLVNLAVLICSCTNTFCNFRCKNSINKGDDLRFSEKSLLLQPEIFKINHYAKPHKNHSRPNPFNSITLRRRMQKTQ